MFKKRKIERKKESYKNEILALEKKHKEEI
jgi:hypothetical protein